jgi:hypothetical protein
LDVAYHNRRILAIGTGTVLDAAELLALALAEFVAGGGGY